MHHQAQRCLGELSFGDHVSSRVCFDLLIFWRRFWENVVVHWTIDDDVEINDEWPPFYTTCHRGLEYNLDMKEKDLICYISDLGRIFLHVFSSWTS